MIWEYFVSLVFFVVGSWIIIGLTYIIGSVMKDLIEEFMKYPPIMTWGDFFAMCLTLTAFAVIIAILYYGTTMVHGALYANDLQIPFI